MRAGHDKPARAAYPRQSNRNLDFQVWACGREICEE
jgi:hypothetical protein